MRWRKFWSLIFLNLLVWFRGCSIRVLLLPGAAIVPHDASLLVRWAGRFSTQQLIPFIIRTELLADSVWMTTCGLSSLRYNLIALYYYYPGRQQQRQLCLFHRAMSGTVQCIIDVNPSQYRQQQRAGQVSRNTIHSGSNNAINDETQQSWIH